MEFTKLVKYGAASLFLILVAHGLVLGFSIPTTVISVVLVSVVCIFEAQLVKSERIKYREQISQLVASHNDLVIGLTKNFEQQVQKLSDELDKQKLKHEQDIQNLKDARSADKVAAGFRR